MENNQQQITNEFEVRKNKIEELKKQGVVVYKDKYEKTCSILDARSKTTGEKVRVAGRLVFRRSFGKLSFIRIQDIDASIQVSLSTNELDDEKYGFFKKYVDIGDFLGVEGEIYTTQTGELTVRALGFELLTKALRPLPEKFHGLTDIDAKYRQRDLDLVRNEDSRNVFLIRHKVLKFIRDYLTKSDFVEVETPCLQTIACGAAARPFITKHNKLDMEMYLRVSPETYLKRVIACGFDKVFELGKCFRNEGMDADHLQEFTMLEWYCAYWNFEDNIKFVTKFIKELLLAVKGNETLIVDGQEIDLSKGWKRVDYTKTLNDILGLNVLDFANVDELKKALVSKKQFSKTELEDLTSLPVVIDYAYKRKMRPNIVEPTILYNYPACLVPLSRRSDADDRLLDMFQLLVNGVELSKAYSELVDPFVQRKTFEEQLENKKLGDDESMGFDEDFLLSMEHGMPPISGLGIGVDRLVKMITGAPTLRDVVLFPTMK